MQKLKQVGLKTYIKSSTNVVDPGLYVTYDDIDNIHKYLAQFQGLLENTPSYSDIKPEVTGIDGSSIVVDSAALNGALFNSTLSRPKTISEVFIEIIKTIDISLSASDVSTEFLSVKDKIGQNLFDDQLLSEDTSLDKRVDDINLTLSQMASDCFNRGSRIGESQNTSVYTLGTEGSQTQEYSLRDLADKLLEVHGGINNLGHGELGQKMVLSSVFPPLSASLTGGDTGYTAPGTSTYDAFIDAPRFYNPTGNTLELQRLFVYIDNNSLVDNVTVAVVKNGIPTAMGLHVAGGATGSAFYNETQIDVEPGSYIQFQVKAGNVPTGSVHIANIALTTQEKT